MFVWWEAELVWCSLVRMFELSELINEVQIIVRHLVYENFVVDHLCLYIGSMMHLIFKAFVGELTDS